MQYYMFQTAKEIRALTTIEALAKKLREEIEKSKENFYTADRFSLNQQNRRYLHRILARITDFVEQNSGLSSNYLNYVSDTEKNRFEVEHIWANKPERFKDEFNHPSEFGGYRNRIGGLLLLRKSFNASYSDLPYEDKLKQYNSQNLLARSLHSQCYQYNPGFIRFKNESGLPFKSHEQFNKVDLDERDELYRLIAEKIWNPDLLLKEVEL